MAEPATRKVSIAIPTCGRPRALRRLLEGLAGLSFAGPVPEIEVIVVDNDAEHSARSTCDDLRTALPWPLRYVVETRRGIAPARNRAVASVADDAVWLAFLDDDEVPASDWLDALLDAQRRFGADAVAGPVLPRFESPLEPWLERGRFFDRPRYASGTPLPRAGTGNVLIRLEALRRLSPAFDETLALVGGEDAAFFARFRGAGYRTVWADDAIVEEWNPPSRSTPRWLLRRRFSVGTRMARLSPSVLGRAGCLAKAIVWLAWGACVWVAGWLGGRRLRLRGLRDAAYGAGLVAGLLGRRVEEYRDVHV